jgi:hypothetical protein
MANNSKHIVTIDGKQMTIRQASELPGAASYFAIWKRRNAGRTDADAVFGRIIYRAKARRVDLDGRSITVADASRLPRAQGHSTIAYRLKLGWPAWDAVYLPVNAHRKIEDARRLTRLSMMPTVELGKCTFSEDDCDDE